MSTKSKAEKQQSKVPPAKGEATTAKEETKATLAAEAAKEEKPAPEPKATHVPAAEAKTVGGHAWPLAEDMPLGLIKQIRTLWVAGKTKDEIKELGYDKTTVSIQTARHDKEAGIIRDKAPTKKELAAKAKQEAADKKIADALADPASEVKA